MFDATVVVLLAVTPAAFICTWLSNHHHPLWAVVFMIVYVAALGATVTTFIDRN